MRSRFVLAVLRCRSDTQCRSVAVLQCHSVEVSQCRSVAVIRSIAMTRSRVSFIRCAEVLQYRIICATCWESDTQKKKQLCLYMIF
jgi:hypothetical protein